MRSRPEACESVRTPFIRAASRAHLMCRDRAPTFAGGGQLEELRRTSFPLSCSRTRRSSCRRLRNVGDELDGHSASHTHLACRALQSRTPFGARAPRPASHTMRCLSTSAHAPRPPSHAQGKVATKSTLRRVEFALELLLRAGFVPWRAGTRERCLAARQGSLLVRSVADDTIGQQ